MFENHVIDPPKYRLGVSTVKIYRFLFILSCIFSHWFHAIVKNKKNINLTVGRFSGHSGSSGFNVDYLKSRNILDTVSSIFNDRFIMYERIIRIENQGVTLNLQAMDYPRKKWI